MVKRKPAGSSIDKANKPKKERNYKKTPWNQYQCSGSSQIPIQDDPNYHQFLSLYHIVHKNELTIYDTESKKEETKNLNTGLRLDLDYSTSITQLPNGELFCIGGYYSSESIVIIDRNYGVRLLPSRATCHSPSVLYFDNNIFCFGGFEIYCSKSLNISRKFDLTNNRWTNLTSLPEGDGDCHSVIFNGNILVSKTLCKNLWLYSIEIDSFSIIPYDFKGMARKFMINVERLYLIEFYYATDGLIYESEDEYHWKAISKSRKLYNIYYPMYCLYNKEKIYISTQGKYYQFDLKKKVVSKLNKPYNKD